MPIPKYLKNYNPLLATDYSRHYVYPNGPTYPGGTLPGATVIDTLPKEENNDKLVGTPKNKFLTELGLMTAEFGLSYGLSALTSSKANSRAKENQRKQNEYNKYMWQLQNLYNSPANQMNLMRQAGLNPNMAYGTLGSAVAPQLESAGSQTFSDSPVNVPNMASMYMQNQQYEENLQIQKDMAKATIRKINAEAESTENENGTYNERFELFKEQTKSQIEQTKQNISVLKQQFNLLGKQVDMADLELLFQRTTFDTRVNQMLETLNLTKAQRQLYLSQSRLMIAQACGVEIDNEIKRETKADYVNMLKSSYKLQSFMNSSEEEMQRDWYKYLGYYSKDDVSGSRDSNFIKTDFKDVEKIFGQRLKDLDGTSIQEQREFTFLLSLFGLMAMDGMKASSLLKK